MLSIMSLNYLRLINAKYYTEIPSEPLWQARGMSLVVKEKHALWQGKCMPPVRRGHRGCARGPSYREGFIPAASATEYNSCWYSPATSKVKNHHHDSQTCRKKRLCRDEAWGLRTHTSVLLIRDVKS